MALPQVGQAQMLANVFDALLKQYRPRSVAVVGCSGGNGFERIDNDVTERVVGVDLNEQYLEELRCRFQRRIPGLELYLGDIQAEGIAFEPVELVFAGLILEYVDVDVVLKRLRALLHPDGILGTVIQLPHQEIALVTPSPCTSLGALGAFMRLVSPERVRSAALVHGYQEVQSDCMESPGGKRFQLQTFRRAPDSGTNANAL